MFERVARECTEPNPHPVLSAFERRLLTLRAERDQVVGVLREDEEAREKAELLEKEILVREPIDQRDVPEY